VKDVENTSTGRGCPVIKKKQGSMNLHCVKNAMKSSIITLLSRWRYPPCELREKVMEKNIAVSVPFHEFIHRLSESGVVGGDVIRLILEKNRIVLPVAKSEMYTKKRNEFINRISAKIWFDFRFGLHPG